METCKSLLPERRYKHVCRVSCLEEFRAAKKAIGKQPALVWLDLTAELKADETEQIRKGLVGAAGIKKNTARANAFALDLRRRA